MFDASRALLPEGLKVSWETPEDQDHFWTLDMMHFPHPLSTIEHALIRTVSQQGMNASFEEYDLPVRAQARHFWTYHYSSITPLMLSPDEFAAMSHRSQEKLRQAMAQLDERWASEWLPEVKEHLAYWNQFPLPEAGMPELLEHLEGTRERLARVWKVHFAIAFPMMMAIHLFDELYQDLFAPDSPLRSYQLLQGFENETLKANRTLWALSRAVLSNDAVRPIFEQPVENVVPALESSREGQAFLADLHAYLAEYGQRGDTWGLLGPTWAEDPTPVISNLQRYIRQPDRDPEMEIAAMVAQRDQAIAEARDRLNDYPEAIRNQFEFMLKAAQAANVLTEDHGYWIDFRAMAAARGVLMELGRRFAGAGVVEQPSDIFHLTFDEIVETASADPWIDRRDLVRERKDEIEHYRHIQPPHAIGTPPPGPAPDDPMSRMMGKFFGGMPKPAGEPGELHGAGGSAGFVRGTARVVRTLAETGKVQPGDILVAETTAPPWTPLFATVAGVVTDAGGILSHCAVVAREYGIPAVVGTGTATAMIADGQTIEVDGNAGIVRIVGGGTAEPAVVDRPQPRPLPVPDNFPVEWQSPDDEKMFWLRERLHWPDPMPPMDFEFMRDAHVQFSWAFASYGVPLQYNVRLINYHWYFSVAPSVADPSEIPAKMQVGLRNLEATLPRLPDLWSNVWLPEVQQHLDDWKRFDLRGASTAELLAHHEETVARHNRVWQIHFLQTLPIYMAMSTFDDLYQDLFGASNGLDAYRLMQGFDNKTVEIGRALWKLSRMALTSPPVRAILERTTPSEVVEALSQSEDGQAFLSELRAFLEEYGQRGEKLGVSFPSWIEDPIHPIGQLQDYVRRPDFNFDEETRRLAAEREHLLTEARAMLVGYPRPVVEQFEEKLRLAQQATVISEDHTFYIDFGSIHQVRRVILEFGRRFAEAGVIDDPNDVFLLTRDELRASAEALPTIRQQTTVARRKAEIEHFSVVPAPPALGTPPDGPPPDDPLTRTVGRFFGAPPPEPEGTIEAPVIRGGAGSSGRATGIARVIRTLADAGRLKPGEILVATTTAPAWTPLFSLAAAVVTDTGGVLSHCAVVAREYGIPAVVGTGMATALIPDGRMIEVDGDLGTVRVIG
jgi:pyruvate,water dikinase